MSYLDQILGGGHEAALEEACAEDFVKSASAENIDLSQYPEDQVMQAYQAFRNDWQQKVAAQDTSTSLIEKAAAEGASDEMLEQLALSKLSGEAMCEGFLGYLAKKAQEAEGAPAEEAPAEEAPAEEAADVNEEEAQAILEQATAEAVEAVTESAPEAAPEEIAAAAAEILPEVVAEKTSQLLQYKTASLQARGLLWEKLAQYKGNKTPEIAETLEAKHGKKPHGGFRPDPGRTPRWRNASRGTRGRIGAGLFKHRLPLAIAGGLAAAGGTALALRRRAKSKQAADILFADMGDMAKQASSQTPALDLLSRMIG